MSDSEDGKLLNDLLEAADEMRRAFPESYDTLLTGSAKVQLVMTVHDVSTPVEAVEVAMRELLRHGTQAFAMAVTDDETGDHFIVRGGQILSIKEARAEVNARVEGDDEPEG